MHNILILSIVAYHIHTLTLTFLQYVVARVQERHTEGVLLRLEALLAEADDVYLTIDLDVRDQSVIYACDLHNICGEHTNGSKRSVDYIFSCPCNLMHKPLLILPSPISSNNIYNTYHNTP